MPRRPGVGTGLPLVDNRALEGSRTTVFLASESLLAETLIQVCRSYFCY
jgi:hypothetical protein